MAQRSTGYDRNWKWLAIYVAVGLVASLIVYLLFFAQGGSGGGGGIY
jgi:hypothetical protein